ncbi:hypothetical protein P7C70_g8229, partial [Phenoliferia sp. Uapishka_3]
IFFFLANVFLVIAPMIPPSAGNAPYTSLPYWLHVVVGFGLLVAGVAYYIVWALILPKFGNVSPSPYISFVLRAPTHQTGKYKLTRELVVGPDGISRNVFHHVHVE